MDILLGAFFTIIAVIGPLFRKMANFARLIPFLAMLFDLIWLSILYSEHVGYTFDSLGLSFTIPMTTVAGGHVFPEAALLSILFVFIDGLAAVAP